MSQNENEHNNGAAADMEVNSDEGEEEFITPNKVSSRWKTFFFDNNNKQNYLRF
jgi:hypothetical protein